MKDAARSHSANHFEGAGDEIIQDEEEPLNGRQDYADIRHQLGMLAAIDPEDRKNVNRKNQTPEKQGAFLARPERNNLKKRILRAAAAFHNICDGKIIR